MSKKNRKINPNGDDNVVGASFVILLLFCLLLFLECIGNKPIIYEDATGKTVVCEVEGVYRTMTSPDCINVEGPHSPTIWNGSCDDFGVCTPVAKIK